MPLAKTYLLTQPYIIGQSQSTMLWRQAACSFHLYTNLSRYQHMAEGVLISLKYIQNKNTILDFEPHFLNRFSHQNNVKSSGYTWSAMTIGSQLLQYKETQ